MAMKSTFFSELPILLLLWSRSSGVSTSSDSMWSVTSSGGSIMDIYLFIYSYGVAIRLILFFCIVEESKQR